MDPAAEIERLRIENEELRAKLRITLLGLEAEGAGAALLGWIAVFLAIILAVRALW